MSRMKLTLAVLSIATAIGMQAAVAQARTALPTRPAFVTDTLAPGGSSAYVPGSFTPAQVFDYLSQSGRKTSDHRVAGKKAHAKKAAGYRLITDTLAPGGSPARPQ